LTKQNGGANYEIEVDEESESEDSMKAVTHELPKKRKK
jgi:hypothetical protein